MNSDLVQVLVSELIRILTDANSKNKFLDSFHTETFHKTRDWKRKVKKRLFLLFKSKEEDLCQVSIESMK